jgi:hypothetical protein
MEVMAITLFHRTDRHSFLSIAAEYSATACTKKKKESQAVELHSRSIDRQLLDCGLEFTLSPFHVSTR